MLIQKVHIEGFKSIEKLSMDLGRVNVLIGENGCGKSNVLEAITMGACAGVGRLEHDQLSAWGVRMAEPRFMRAAFDNDDGVKPIRIYVDHALGRYSYDLRDTGTPTVPRWTNVAGLPDALKKAIEQFAEVFRLNPDPGLFLDHMIELGREYSWVFIIYSPESTALRTFQTEAQVLPLGIRGEGLFAHLKALAGANPKVLEAITRELSLLDWFERLEIPGDLSVGERSIRLRDRYLAPGALFDQRSANEGFLFLLFYFTLLLSPDTPSFFAIDNVDASLNPKLCEALVKRLTELAPQQGKQIILTTHNPAVLDGLDLNDDAQRLFVVHRSSRGRTKARRVMPPKPLPGDAPVKLSEAFLRGYLGGLPKSF